jgi:two-component system, cell cycle response regulator DivK
VIKIAYVEDEARNHFTFEQYTILLRAHGIDNALSIYMTGEDALKAIPTDVPDIIFMDVRLPGITGLDVTRALRKDDKLKALPIIALTAYAMPADRQAALDAGCDDFLAKPVRYQAVEDIIRRYLVAAPKTDSSPNTPNSASNSGTPQ